MPAKKRQRLHVGADVGTEVRDLLHVGGVSMKGLQEILRRLQCPANRSTLQRVNRDVFDQHRVVQALNTLDGGQFLWEYLGPDSWMAAVVERRPSLNAAFAEAWRRHPASPTRPWSLVLGFDEFAPGNKLQVDNRSVASQRASLALLFGGN
jgi:hypothetical protein